MDATAGSTVRSFASNTLDRNDVERLKGIYASDPLRDRSLGGTRFTAAFDATLPSELGNRNGLITLPTRLGSARFYYEAFADAGPLWIDLRSRMAAGELWVRLFGRWAERSIEDPSRKEALRAYVDRELVPLVCDAVLLWSVQASTVRFSRVDQVLRDPADPSPANEDERFVQRVGMPLLMLLTERGVFTADESQRLLLLGVDGRLSEAEREDAVETIFKPAFLRQARRFRPQMQTFDSGALVAMALSFSLYATTSSDRNEVLLASAAIPDEDKEAIRAGRGGGVRLPPPFGFDPIRSGEPLKAEVRLKTGRREPFSHNGRWDPERGEVRFTAEFSPPERRVTLFPPVFHASWSEPDGAEQRRLFGRTILEDEDLAGYAVWVETLPDPLRRRWESALDRLASTGEIDQLEIIRRETEATRPMPRRLSDWIRRRGEPQRADGR